MKKKLYLVGIFLILCTFVTFGLNGVYAKTQAEWEEYYYKSYLYACDPDKVNYLTESQEANIQNIYRTAAKISGKVAYNKEIGNTANVLTDSDVAQIRNIVSFLESIKTSANSAGDTSSANKLDNIIREIENNSKASGFDSTGGETCSGGWWECASNWWGKTQSASADTNADELIGTIVPMIQSVGNVIFLIVASVLGVKYIWGSVEAKSSVKESLLTFIVAALLFYGGTALGDLVNIQSYISQTSAEATASNIYYAIRYIINFLAVGGVVYIGVKYMISGAEAKADMKVKMLPAILGIIMVYGTVSFISTILEIFL